MKIDNRCVRCKACNTVVYTKDTQEGLCINCLYAELKKEREQKQTRLFGK